MNINDEINLVNFLKKYIKKDSKILDIGCGIGSNLEILNNHGYKNIYGVDISDEMVIETKEKGFIAYTVDDFFSNNTDKFDLLLFSHVLEHIAYPDIVNVLESYFKKTNNNAKIIIIMPVLYDAFFNDIDHIKPYYPDGLLTLFSDKIVSKQYQSKYFLEIIDIEFRKQALVPYNLKSRYIRSFKNKLFLKIFTTIMKIIQLITFNILSKTTGYAAIFELKNHK